MHADNYRKLHMELAHARWRADVAHKNYANEYERHRNMRSDFKHLQDRVRHLEHLEYLTEEFSHREAGELRRQVESFKSVKKGMKELREENTRLRSRIRVLEQDLKRSRKKEASEKIVRLLHNLSEEIRDLKAQVREGNGLIEMLTDKVDTLTAENTALTIANRDLRGRFARRDIA